MSDVSCVNGSATDDARHEVGTAPGFSVIDEIAVQHGAIGGIAVSADGGRLLVTHYGDDTVSLIDTGDRPVARTVVDTGEPFAVALAGSPAGRAYVSTVSTAYDTILAVDMDSDRVAAYPVAHSVTDLAVSPDGKHVYACRNAVNGADVAVLDTKTGREDAIGIAATPGTTTECVRVSPDGQRLYVATNGPSGGVLVVIDAQQKRVVNTVEIGSPIRDVAISPDGATAYVASCDPDFGAVLDVVDTHTDMVAGTHKVREVAGHLTQLTLSRDGERAYLVGDESVAVLGIRTCDVIGTIVVGAQPSCVIESPDGNRLYIADYAGTVTVLTIALTAASALAPRADQPTADDEPTAPHQRATPELRRLEPALA